MFGAIIAPMKGEYCDHEGYAGRSFGRPWRAVFSKDGLLEELKKVLF